LLFQAVRNCWSTHKHGERRVAPVELCRVDGRVRIVVSDNVWIRSGLHPHFAAAVRTFSISRDLAFDFGAISISTPRPERNADHDFS